MAQGSDARTAQDMDDIQIPQRGGAVRSQFQCSRQLEKTQGVHKLRRRGFVFYLWINGKYVGFSKNSRSLAQFDITKYLVKGANRVAVEVYRCSDGSFLETQDMFRMAGIIRSVYLTATPEIHVGDVVAIPDLDSHYINGALNVKLSVSNQSAKDAKRYSMHCSLYPVELYGDGTSNAPVAKAAVEVGDITKQGKAQCEMQLTVPNVKPWSAEAPWRYVLVGELKDKKGRTVETFSTYTGFRKVEIRDTPARFDEFGKAGRYFYVNGRTVKLKGVNRHETNPERGHAVTREQMDKEVMLMKRANINHVRNSHYPDSPYWYYLCDKYGIYLEDECNIEFIFITMAMLRFRMWRNSRRLTWHAKWLWFAPKSIIPR